MPLGMNVWEGAQSFAGDGGPDWAEIAKYALGGLGGQEQQQTQQGYEHLVPPQSMRTQPPQQRRGMPRSQMQAPAIQQAAKRLLVPSREEESHVGGAIGTALGALAGGYIPVFGPALGSLIGGAAGSLVDEFL